MPDYPDDFLRLLQAVTKTRPKTIIAHILEHGSITSEEIRDVYGYAHPPRAARDVREAGVPLQTFSVKGSDGRHIAAYRFGDPSAMRTRRVDGRTAISSAIKKELAAKHGSQCFLYLEPMKLGRLQLDHRVPYEIIGDHGGVSSDGFMLLSPAANRAKSWSCEHCPNGMGPKDPAVCRSCYWAFPEDYTHVATEPMRRLDLMWRGEDVAAFDLLRDQAEGAGEAVPSYVKDLIRRALKHGA